MFVSILGRQPALGIAELERIYGSQAVSWLSKSTALVQTDTFNFEQLGGSQKAGRVVLELPHGDWRSASLRIVKHYSTALASVEYKVTLGISVYDLAASPRDIQKTGVILKQKLRQNGVSLRLIPNSDAALNTATSHHNKLGLSANKIELLVVRGTNGKIIVAESLGAQNITALAARDQARPYTDAFVGMLPPKLARMMINLAVGSESEILAHSERHLQPESQATTIDLRPGAKRLKRESEVHTSDNARARTILDPFCGTGVVLQEALLLGYDAYGSDLSEKMVDYTTKNLDWLKTKYSAHGTVRIEHGDATKHTWQQPITTVVCESYLGQPFSAPPSPAKLTEVTGNCNHIISEFLRNIAPQLKTGTPLCIAVPAWRSTDGSFTHLPLTKEIGDLGYARHTFSSIRDEDLLYYRENQVVARELLVLTRR
jgi:tRNA G10  N-methylase Trm11